MKKAFLSLLIAFIMIAAFGCSGSADSMEAVVFKVEDESISFSITKGTGDIGVAAITDETKLIGEDGKEITLSDIEPGQLIKITHSGIVQTMFPPRYPGIKEVQVLGTADEELITQAKDRWKEWE